MTLQLSWAHQFQFAGYYVAQQRGYFRAAGLEVDIRAAGPGTVQPIDAVVQGKAQFGVTNSGLSVARMNGRPVVAVAAVLQRPAMVWVVQPGLAGLPLRDLAAQPGMRLPSTEESVELLLPFARAGVDVRHLASQASSFSIESFVRGEVGLHAAYRSNELPELRRRGVAFAVIDPANADLPAYGEVLFTSEGLARRDPSLVRRFREAALRGWREALADVPGTAAMIQARYAPTRSLEQLTSEGVELKALVNLPEIEVGQMSPTRWLALAQAQRDAGFGKAPLEVEPFLFEAAVGGPPVWPDPVRIGLAGLSAALFMTVVFLLRTNGRLVRQAADERQLARRQHAEARRFQFLMDVAPYPVAIFELAGGRPRYLNDRADQWMRQAGASEDMPIQSWLSALAPGTPIGEAVQRGQAVRDREVELAAGQAGDSRWCRLTVRAIEYDGADCGFATFADISARKRAEAELLMVHEQRKCFLDEVKQLQVRLRDASVRDPLTGLFNRRYLDGTVEREIARCRREGRPLSLLVLDIDHFKAVNDHHGHAGGDVVLRSVGQMLAEMHRGDDVCCRFGGEEFVLLLPGATIEGAESKAEALRQRAAALRPDVGGVAVGITVSIGVAEWGGADPAGKNLFERADAALYQAKRQGRDRVVRAPSGAPMDTLA